MYMTTYEPWGILDRVRRDLDQYLTSNQPQSNLDSAIATSAWIPAVDIKEDVQQFVIDADIPGVDPKDLEVNMENGVLDIRGERKSASSEDTKDYKHVERICGSFHRRFSLPESADFEKVDANFKNGVLELTIPKRTLTHPHKITVHT